MTNVYRVESERVAKLALSMWNRDPASPSFGSFDRLYWGWKFKDFSDATLQYAVKVVIAYSVRAGSTSVISDWLEGYVRFCRSIQLPDGSFDQCYPNERTPGVVYDILSTLIHVRESPLLTSDAARRELDAIIERAAAFALKTDEKHGEVANHIAEFAYELLRYASFSSNARARHRAEEYLERLLRLFDREEGWFQEYHGPDAGYQTRCLRYVVKCAALLSSDELWDVAGRGARFVGDLLMPDGSIHPMLGVRSTALLYPFAFETLAARDRSFVTIARAVCGAWENGAVPLPSTIDFQNAIRLADDANDAADVVEREPAALEALSAAAPQPERPWIHYPHAGIAVRKEKDFAVYVAYRLGGAVVVYQRDGAGGWRLAFENAGYLVRSRDRKHALVSRMPNAGTLRTLDPERLVLRTTFQASLHDELTPGRLVLLRVLNLTVLRVQWIGDLFRKIVVRRLMGEHAPEAIALTREVSISCDSIRVCDDIRDQRRTSDRGELLRCRRVTGLHMASSRYFQPAELEGGHWFEPVPWSEDGVATTQITIPLACVEVVGNERKPVDAAGG